MTGMALATPHATNYTAISITLGILFIVGAVIAVTVASYFRLQGHRADAVAMAHYRKLAEDGLWVPLFVLDTIVFTVWLTFLAGVTLPAWYWAPRGNAGIGYTSPTTIHGVSLGYFPHGPNGRGAVGLYVDTLPKALLAAAVFLVLFLIFNYVLVITARAHAAVARSLLRAPADPLAEAKGVLAGPGPLGPLKDRMPNGGSPVGHPA